MSTKAIAKILVPVELVGDEPPTVEYSLRVAKQLDAELIFLAVIDTAAAASMIRRVKMRHDRSEGFNEMLVKEAQAVLQEFVDEAGEMGVKAWGHASVNEEVEAQILKEAIMQKVDLILVRSHGRSGLSRALLGSTAGEILKAAPCPVLVARA